MNGYNKLNKIERIVEYLDKEYPDVECELNFSNNLELVIAVLLSAQCKDEYVNRATVGLFERYKTIDEYVNRATVGLFERYKTIDDYADAEIEEIESLIKTLGLYKAKSKNIKKMAEMLRSKYNYEVPHTREELESLPGVGRKTANVVMSVGFDLPAIAVDTHVERVSKRLELVEEKASPLKVEQKLMSIFPMDKWSKLHHQFIHFGRYKCKAKNPDCISCELVELCNYKNKKL